MTVTPSQKHVIDCVLAIFETGKVPTPGSYATCAILNDGAGISFGKHQSTDRANSLDLVVKRYIQKGGLSAKQLEPFLPYFAANKSATEPPRGPWSMETQTVVNILRAAVGSSPSPKPEVWLSELGLTGGLPREPDELLLVPDEHLPLGARVGVDDPRQEAPAFDPPGLLQ